MRKSPIPFTLGALVPVFFLATVATAGPPTGLLPTVAVEAPTRLPADHVSRILAPGAPPLAADYDSSRHRYRLFVPANYRADRAWPLLVFVAAGDAARGQRPWEAMAASTGSLCLTPYGLGASAPMAERVRRLLDGLDDVRRHYRIDAEQTYLIGQGDGSFLAYGVAMALPECVGGAIAWGGSVPTPPPGHARHRAADRLSFALLRPGSFGFTAPLLHELAIRTRTWDADGDAGLTPDLLTEVHAWLTEDLPRRRADARDRPGLALADDDTRTADERAAGALEAAEAELARPERTWRGMAALEELRTRWSTTPAAALAARRLEQLSADPIRRRFAVDGRLADEQLGLRAEARAHERDGDLLAARRSWRALADSHADSAAGRAAVAEAGRLAAAPYLGAAFESGAPRVTRVVPDGPAARAGLRAGDLLTRFAQQPVATLRGAEELLAATRPGEEVEVEVERDGRAARLILRVGALPTGGGGRGE